MQNRFPCGRGQELAYGRGRAPFCQFALANSDQGCGRCCLGPALSSTTGNQAVVAQTFESIENLDFQAGYRLYGAGDAGKYFYSLRSGLIKLIQHLPNGSTRIVRLLGKGDIAGMEILCHPLYQHTAVTLERANACRIRKSRMMELERHSQRLRKELAERWEQNLEMADMWITQLSTGLVSARLARLIRLLAQKEGTGLSRQVRLPYREDIASMLGVAQETVCRTLSELQRQRILLRVEGRLFEFDADALENLATK